jgi:hypothetical protein
MRIKIIMWLGILFDPLMLHWIMFCCIISCLGSSLSYYVDVLSIIPSFCINPLEILIVLIPFFLYFSQECWAVFCVVICCATMHTCHRWKWTVSCIMSRLLTIVADYCPSSSTSTSESTSISFLCIVLGYMVILRGIILWLCIIVLRLH